MDATSMLIAPTFVRLLTTEAGMKAWLASAKPGDAIEYHRGFLILDRQAFGSRLPARDRAELDRLAGATLTYCQQGRAHLVQRRYGDGDYSYILVARSPRSKGSGP